MSVLSAKWQPSSKQTANKPSSRLDNTLPRFPSTSTSTFNYTKVERQWLVEVPVG